MSLLRKFGRFVDLVKALLVGGVLIFAAVGIGVLVDAVVVNSQGPAAAGRVVHLRYYVLPLGGFAAMAGLVLGRALPAGTAAASVWVERGPLLQALRHFGRAVTWFLAALLAFGAASAVQQSLFGFFLPT